MVTTQGGVAVSAPGRCFLIYLMMRQVRSGGWAGRGAGRRPGWFTDRDRLELGPTISIYLIAVAGSAGAVVVQTETILNAKIDSLFKV